MAAPNRLRTRPAARPVALACALSLGTSLWPAAPVRAEVTTWSEEARRSLEGDLETPELRTLRIMEQELFGSGPVDAPEAYDPDCVYGTPDSLSSEAPPQAAERGGAQIDLAWLSELEMPNIPVRWDERVIDYLLFFKNNRSGRNLMASWLRRSELYGPMIRRVLAEASMPSDLQYVAMVESGYDPRARSQVAAQGLWQFMQRSGSHYGLRIDRWVDERLNPGKATLAATRFLGDLYKRFGAWELAMAAYNMGYGGLLRSIRKFNTNDYWLLSHIEAGMPYETSLYVAKITAVAIIANNPERFGFGDLSRKLPVALRTVQVPAGTPLRPIARTAGIETEALMDINPELRRKRIPPGDEPWTLSIPAEKYDEFVRRWSRNRSPALSVSYTMRFGETLEDVARRYGTSPSKLRKLNEMKSHESAPAGLAIVVPSKKPKKTLNGELPVATVPAQEFVVPGRNRVFYRVSRHDTAEAVSRFFRVPESDLATWNQLAPGAALQRKMLLQIFVDPDLDLGRAVVFTPDEVRILAAGSEEFFDYHEAQRDRARVRYIAQPKDTLSSLGERFDLSVGSVARINQYSTKHELQVGEQVILYVPVDELPKLQRRGVLAPSPTLGSEVGEPLEGTDGADGSAAPATAEAKSKPASKPGRSTADAAREKPDATADAVDPAPTPATPPTPPTDGAAVAPENDSSDADPSENAPAATDAPLTDSAPGAAPETKVAAGSDANGAPSAD